MIILIELKKISFIDSKEERSTLENTLIICADVLDLNEVINFCKIRFHMVRSRTVTENQRRTTFDDERISSPIDCNDNEKEHCDREVAMIVFEETNDASNTSDKEETRLKSNVWQYARKITSSIAICNKCQSSIKTTHGSTSTLRKHLITRHNLKYVAINGTVKSKKIDSLTEAKKMRLDHLLNLAIFEDDRSFGDFHKNGVMKFLAEALPGKIE